MRTTRNALTPSPDRIEFDKASGEYLLRFNSGWKEAGVQTRLRFRKSELDAHFRGAKGEAR